MRFPGGPILLTATHDNRTTSGLSISCALAWRDQRNGLAIDPDPLVSHRHISSSTCRKGLLKPKRAPGSTYSKQFWYRDEPVAPPQTIKHRLKRAQHSSTIRPRLVSRVLPMSRHTVVEECIVQKNNSTWFEHLQKILAYHLGTAFVPIATIQTPPHHFVSHRKCFQTRHDRLLPIGRTHQTGAVWVYRLLTCSKLALSLPAPQSGKGPMIPGMAPDGMPAICDLLDQLRAGGCRLSDQEKGTPCLIFFEKCQDARGALGIRPIIEGQ